MHRSLLKYVLFVLLIDHYLACDGQRVFLKEVLDRDDVRDGKYPELNFQ